MHIHLFLSLSLDHAFNQDVFPKVLYSAPINFQRSDTMLLIMHWIVSHVIATFAPTLKGFDYYDYHYHFHNSFAYALVLLRQAICKVPAYREAYTCVFNVFINKMFKKIMITIIITS